MGQYCSSSVCSLGTSRGQAHSGVEVHFSKMWGLLRIHCHDRSRQLKLDDSMSDYPDTDTSELRLIL